jgi:hypothetical protein
VSETARDIECHGGAAEVIVVFIRECIVLLVGVAVSLLASRFANAGRDFGALAAALLVFEMGVAMFAGDAGIPFGAWAVVAGFGTSYVLLFCLAHRMGHSPGHYSDEVVL